MKKLMQVCLTLFIVWGLLPVHANPAAANTVLSDPILMPASPASPVRVKLPDLPAPLEVTALRVLPAGAAIAADNQAGFNILCPDLTQFEVLPGKPFTCPPTPAATLVVQLPSPIEIVPPRPIRGEGEVMIAPEEKNTLQEAVRQINQFPIEDGLKRFLLANLYAARRLYPDALAQLENQPTIRQNPAAMRLLGSLYLRTEKLREAGTAYQQALELSQNMRDFEGQASAHHQLAVIYESLANNAEALQQAQSALKIYQTLGRGEGVAQIQEFIEKLGQP